MACTFPDLCLADLLTDDFAFPPDLNNTTITDIPLKSLPVGVDSALPVLSPDEVDAIFSDENSIEQSRETATENHSTLPVLSPDEKKNSVEQPQETTTENHPFLNFIQSMATMTQNEDVIPSSHPGKRNTPNLAPPRKIKFPHATMTTVLDNKATSFTPPDPNPTTPLTSLDSYSQAVINGLVDFRSCHNLHQARHQFPELSHEAFFPPSLQTIFDFHRGLTSVSNLGQLLPILVFLNELPNFPPVGPTILAVEGNNGPMIETRWMWRSRFCPFVQCRCENQELVPKLEKNTVASL